MQMMSGVENRDLGDKIEAGKNPARARTRGV